MTDTATPELRLPLEEEIAELRRRSHPNVVVALAAATSELEGIRKMTPAERRAKYGTTGGGDGEQGVTYAYRGIDQIEAAAQAVLGRHGVIVVPRRIVDLEVGIVMRGAKNDKPWRHVTLKIEWRIYGPGGIGDVIRAESLGEGLDNSDKAYNKASTGARKNALLSLLRIGDPDDDPDKERHDLSDGAPEPAAVPDEHALDTDALRAELAWFGQSGGDLVPAMKAWVAERGRDLKPNTLYHDPQWRAEVRSWLAEHPVAASTPADSTEPPAPTEAPVVRDLARPNDVKLIAELLGAHGVMAPLDLDTVVASIVEGATLATLSRSQAVAVIARLRSEGEGIVTAEVEREGVVTVEVRWGVPS